MLDQNTDRMWFVIGAVVIGAAIIAAALFLFNDTGMVAIKGFMEKLTSQASNAVDNIDSADKVTTPTIMPMLQSLKGLPLF